MKQEMKGIIEGIQRKQALSLPTREDTVCIHHGFNWKNKRLLCFANPGKVPQGPAWLQSLGCRPKEPVPVWGILRSQSESRVTFP